MMPRRPAVRSTFRGLLRVLSPLVLSLVVLSVMVVPSCRTPAGVDDSPASLLDTRWVLASLSGGTITAPAPTLAFEEEGRVHGSSGVNRFGGDCTIDGTQIRFGSLMSTKMAGPPERMELERRYLEVLGKATRWSVTKGRLTLADAEGALAVFESEPPE